VVLGLLVLASRLACILRTLCEESFDTWVFSIRFFIRLVTQLLPFVPFNLELLCLSLCVLFCLWQTAPTRPHVRAWLFHTQLILLKLSFHFLHPYPILIHLLICWLFQHPFSPRYSLAVDMCFCVDFVKGIIVKVILMYLYVSLFRAGQCTDLFQLLFFLTDFSYGLFGGVLCISNPPFMWFVG